MQQHHSYPIPPPFCPNYPEQIHSTHLSISDNSSGYEKKLHEKNLQLTQLQFYIKNIARCIGIVVLLSEKGQDNQFNTFIKCYTFLQVNYLRITITFNKTLIVTKNFRAFYKTNPVFIPHYVSFKRIFHYNKIIRTNSL